MTFRIDSNVPIPPRSGRKPRSVWTAWPFAQMRCGDSFFLARDDQRARNISPACAEYSRANPAVRFTMRTLDDDIIERKPGIRVWRTQ
jgi:hypothetical protein